MSNPSKNAHHDFGGLGGGGGYNFLRGLILAGQF